MRVRNLVLGTLLLAALGAALGAGFLVGRRLPRGLADRLRARIGMADSAALRSPWTAVPLAPFQVFEAAVASTGGTMFVFGGFQDRKLRVSPAVWAFDVQRQTWERRKDMPVVLTHAPPALLDGLLWFAGGFTGDHPGPATADVWRYDPKRDSWIPGPPLPAPRGGGALVELNGKLHFFGGYLEDRNTGSTDHWVLSPRTADSLTWVRATALPVPRGHMAGVAVAGAILAIGGCIEHDPFPVDVDLVHRYDPALDRWTEVAKLPTPRSHFEPATFVRHGKVVIIGGRSRPTGYQTVADVTEYDPVTDRWRALAPLPEPRLAPVGAWVGDRIIVGVGGRVTSNPDTRGFWHYRDDVSWTPGDSLPEPLGGVAGGIIGDRLYLVGQGAQWTLTFDLGTGRWLPLGTHANRPTWAGHDHAAEVWNGRLYLLGSQANHQGGIVQIFDPVKNEWRLGPRMPFAAGSSASALIGGQIYVAGGIAGDSTTTSLAARYDPEREVWTAIAPMPKGRNHAASATDGQRLFVFGGRGPGSGDSNVVADGFADVQIYDPATDRWIASGDGPEAPAPLPEARGGMGKAVYVHGEFWVFGGETEHGHGASSQGTYARVDIYDPRANRWRSGPPMPTPRHGIFPLLDGDRILILGGGTSAGGSRSTVSEILQLPRAAP